MRYRLRDFLFLAGALSGGLPSAQGAARVAPPVPEDPAAPVITATETPVVEPGYFTSEADFQYTSDQIIDRKLLLSYRNHRRDPDWAFPGEARAAWDFGVVTELHSGKDDDSAYTGWKVGGLVSRKVSPELEFEATAGPTVLSTNETSTTVFADLSAYWHPLEQVAVNLHFLRDYVYSDLILPGGANDHIAANTYGVDGRYEPWEFIRVTYKATYGIFSDTNLRRFADVGVLYGISRGVPWIWAGLGGELLSYADENSAYWSPQKFSAFGPRAEADIPIYGKFSCNFGLSLSRNQQDSFDPGFGYYGEAKIRYGTREHTMAEVGYTRIQSIQESEIWTENEFTLDLDVSF